MLLPALVEIGADIIFYRRESERTAIFLRVLQIASCSFLPSLYPTLACSKELDVEEDAVLRTALSGGGRARHGAGAPDC